MANCVDSYEMACYELSHLNPHCLHRCLVWSTGMKRRLRDMENNSGPSCSKLTTSLVKDSLKFTSSDTQIC